MSVLAASWILAGILMALSSAMLLTENQQLNILVLRDRIRRVYLVHRDRRPLLVTATPCTAAVEWHVFHRNATTRNGGVPVASFYGNESMLFVQREAEPGVYVLELDSEQGDTSVQLYATSESVYPFAQLPSDPKVDVLKVRDDQVLFSWKASQGTPDLEYCVAANRRENLRTLCAAITALRKRNDVFYECVGGKTWHRFHNLHVGQTYFVDVYARNRRTNLSTAYPGTHFVARSPPSVRVRDSQTVRLVVDQGEAAVAKYVLRKRVPALWLLAQSCSGPGPVQLTVSLGRKQVLEAPVMDSRVFTLAGPMTGTYVINVTSPVSHMRRVHVVLSRKYRKFPYPALPADNRVKVMESLTTCDSVTLAWRSVSDEKVRYCVYKRESAVEQRDDTCQEEWPRSGKVTCRRYHRFSRQRFQDVIMQKVNRLRPDASYVFQVLVTKLRGKTLPYEPVWATTPRTCMGRPPS
ncbi:protein NDNF-like [Ornithodoros turicata]|uniref:protein NDNF-like n=1 Tax=Ornithodoros turicata TaxID=34597 RepID=UPI00313A318A